MSMTLRCLTKCQVGDRVTICYTNDTGPNMSNKFTRYQREFLVIRMVDYYGGDHIEPLMVPMIGSNNKKDGMHPARNSYYSKEPLMFPYEWMVYPDYNFIVKIRKKQK